ncbi:MAG: ankyrin repeat domain-containing protein [Polyangiaceae bacterium]|nr:ankyrin repeat domain-containing protein [Polyangiaceae bacterium]
MQATRVRSTLQTITDLVARRDHGEARRLARELWDALARSEQADPMERGWARFYDFKCSYELCDYRAAFALLDEPPAASFVMPSKNVAWMHSVGAELALHLGLPREVVRFGQKCLELRRASGDRVGQVQCARTVCTLLEQLGRGDLETEFRAVLQHFADDSRAMARAAQNDDPIEVERLRGEGVPVDVRDDFGRTPLLHAAFAGADGVVALLLRAGADVHVRNDQQRTALVLAADQGHTRVVEQLLDAGADPDHPGLYEQTALILASWQGHLDTVRLLLARGADPSRRDCSGNTALTLTATEDQPEVVRALVAGGSLIDAPTPAGHTALMKAAMEGKREVVRVLLELGADATLVDGDGFTASDWAGQEGFGDIEVWLRRLTAAAGS